MAYDKKTWDQLKNTDVKKLISALKRDGWIEDVKSKKAPLVFDHPNGRRIVVHFHPKKTYRPGLLKMLLAETGWQLADLQRLKLIK